MTTDAVTQSSPSQSTIKLTPAASCSSSPSTLSRTLVPLLSISSTATALLTNGCVLTAYVAEPHSIVSSASYFTRSISLFYNGDSKSLYWNEPSRRDLRESHSIPLQSITALFVGKLSPVLQWLAVSADPERCFAVQYAGGKWLELEAESESQRLDWLHVLNHLLLANNSAVSEENVDEPTAAAYGLDDVPIDPLCSLSSIPAPNTDSALPVVCPLNLHSYERKTKRFVVQSSTAPASSSAISPVPTSLSQTLLQFNSWLDERPNDGPAGTTLAPASGPHSGTHTPVPNQRTRASIFVDNRLQSAQAFSANKSAAVAPRKNSTAPTVLAKDDPRSLEGSLSKLNAGIGFTYCPPASENTVVSAVPDDVPRAASVSDSLPSAAAVPSPTSPTSKGGNVNHSTLDALTNEPPQPHVVGQPMVAVRQASLSETICNILLFYQPHARRSTGRVGNFGQLSWCDSMTWTRKSTWKMALHVNTTIYLGKHTANFKRDLYASLPAEKCFSIVNEDTGTSVDLVADDGWISIKAWLYAFDRVLRSSGFTMVREGAMNGTGSSTAAGGSFSLVVPLSPANTTHPTGGSNNESAPVKIVFILQSELEEHARRIERAAGRRSGALQRNFQKLDIEPNHEDFVRHKRNISGGLGRANPETPLAPSPLRARMSMSPIIPKLGDSSVALPSPSRPAGSLAPIEKGARTPNVASEFARQMSDLQIPARPNRNTFTSNGEPLLESGLQAELKVSSVPTALPQRSPLQSRTSMGGASGVLGGGALGSASPRASQLPDAIGRAPPLQQRPSLNALSMNSLPSLASPLSPDAGQVTPAASSLRRFSLNKTHVSGSPSISAPTPSPL